MEVAIAMKFLQGSDPPLGFDFFIRLVAANKQPEKGAEGVDRVGDGFIQGLAAPLHVVIEDAELLGHHQLNLGPVALDEFLIISRRGRTGKLGWIGNLLHIVGFGNLELRFHEESGVRLEPPD